MFLFIFESIGTSELIVIGIVALIFLGPRRLPEIARKIGKIMADFRNTTSEFKSTWEREVNFEEETEALRLDEIEEEAEPSIAQAKPILETEHAEVISAPEVKEIDKESFDLAAAEHAEQTDTDNEAEVEPADTLSDKRTWL